MDTPTEDPPIPALTCAQPDLHAHTVQETELARTLGFERTDDLRKLIKAQLPTMAALGSLCANSAPFMADEATLAAGIELRLTPAQAAFIATKAGTAQAESFTAYMAEVLAMVTEGKLVPADDAALEELDDARVRDMMRTLAAE